MSIAAATCAPGVNLLPLSRPAGGGGEGEGGEGPGGGRGGGAPPPPSPSARAPPSPAVRERGSLAAGREIYSTVLRVIGGFAGDRDVVDVALAQPSRGDPHEGAVLLHLADRAVAGIAHRRPQSADQLVDDVADRPLVRYAALDALGHELQRAGHLLLEIAVRGTARHRPDRAHPAVVLVAPALIEKHLARALVGTGEQ